MDYVLILIFSLFFADNILDNLDITRGQTSQE